MKDRFLKQAAREYNPRQRLVALSVEAVFFIVILPFALIALGSWIDQWLRWPRLTYQPINLVLGGLFIVAGWLFAMWSIYVQFTLGRGTPVPLMATQKLIVQPPYAYCRNPMALGAIVLYLGVAILFGSLGAAVLVLLGAAWLLTYIKRVEEKEMEMRFGQEYLEYKRQTPFLIPRGAAIWGGKRRSGGEASRLD
jgi:protein-S-isoprenylcysteine O-methyltransferase Ste14